MPGTLVDIVIHLPGDSDVKLKGRVMSSFKTPVISIKNGMGIEILENDPQYTNFVRSVVPEDSEEPASGGPKSDIAFQENIPGPSPEEPLQPEFTIITCPECGVRNKVKRAKLSLRPRCGKCGYHLTSQA